jgi:hypothetical protein
MERSVASKVAAEREKDGESTFLVIHRTAFADVAGLIIVSAHYGLAANFTDRGMRDQDETGEQVIIDVTVPVQSLVNESQLYIPGGRAKHNLLGFYVSHYCTYKQTDQVAGHGSWTGSLYRRGQEVTDKIPVQGSVARGDCGGQCDTACSCER